MKSKVRLGFAGIKFTNSFWGFKDEQYKARIQELRGLASKCNVELASIPHAFDNSEDAKSAAEILNQKSDLVILDVATFPEGKAAGVFIDALIPPVMLWSRSESEHGTHIGHNSFCGANFIAGNLALKNRRFRHLYGDADSIDFRARLVTAIELVRAAKLAAGSTIGLFGEGIVPKFFDLDIQPADRAKLKQRWNISFAGVPIQDLVERANSYKDGALDKLTDSFGKRFSKISVSKEALRKQAGIYKAIADITKEEGYTSTAVRCWPELQGVHDLWPCPSVSVLNDTGIPCACEGDPAGALDMLLAAKMTSTPSTLIDIVDWDKTQKRFTIWHCGPTACSWADQGKTQLIPHNVDGITPQGTPATGLPGVVDMTFAPGPVTVFRTLGAVDDEFVVQGALVRSPKHKISGCCGTVSALTVYDQSRSAASIRDEIMFRTLPHHYVAARGHLFARKD